MKHWQIQIILFVFLSVGFSYLLFDGAATQWLNFSPMQSNKTYLKEPPKHLLIYKNALKEDLQRVDKEISQITVQLAHLSSEKEFLVAMLDSMNSGKGPLPPTKPVAKLATIKESENVKQERMAKNAPKENKILKPSKPELPETNTTVLEPFLVLHREQETKALVVDGDQFIENTDGRFLVGFYRTGRLFAHHKELLQDGQLQKLKVVARNPDARKLARLRKFARDFVGAGNVEIVEESLPVKANHPSLELNVIYKSKSESQARKYVKKENSTGSVRSF